MRPCPGYAAFLRGITPGQRPVNATMSELRATFEAAGFEKVVTVLGSGNVVFDARAQSPLALEKKAEQAMTARLGRSFMTIVRPVEALDALLAADPLRGAPPAEGSEARRDLPARGGRGRDVEAPGRAGRRDDLRGARRRGVHGLRAEPARGGVHGAEDVRQGGHHAHWDTVARK